MSAQRIDPLLVEKVAKAIHNEEWVKKGYGPWEKCVDQDRIRRLAEVEIRVVLDELGLKEERRSLFRDPLGSLYERPEDERSRVGDEFQVRLVGDYRPVGQGDAQ